MKRPLLTRFGPDRLRASLFWHLYRGKEGQWRDLYTAASLRYAGNVQMELVPGDLISDSIAFTGVYEAVPSKHILERARRGGTLVDIGANLGYFALLWASADPSNRCIAFEASPRNIEILRRNVSRNGFDRQITVVPYAVGAKPGKLHFDVGAAEQTGWGGFVLERNQCSIELDVVRVDEVIAGNERIQCLKVDIEGADLWALQGCERLLRAGLVEEVWYEQNKPRMKALGISPDAIQEYLHALGFKTSAHNPVTDELVEWSAVPMRS